MRFLVCRRQTAAASSGNSIFLLGVLVGCWSLDTRLLLVLMAGGAAWTALAAVLERVLADGGSEGSGGVSIALPFDAGVLSLGCL